MKDGSYPGTEEGKTCVSGDMLAQDMSARLGLLDAAASRCDVTVLASAYRYLLQARRLAYASSHSTEFIAERLLNLYKAIEVVFGRNAEQLRKEFENKVALLKQKETRLHQLAGEISGSIASQTTGRPMSQEHRRKISFTASKVGQLHWSGEQ